MQGGHRLLKRNDKKAFSKGYNIKCFTHRISFFIYFNVKCQKTKVEVLKKWIQVLDYLNLYSTHSIEKSS